MRFIISLLLSISVFSSIAQTAYFKTNQFDKFALSYELQKSTDKSSWTTIQSITPKKADSASYEFTVPQQTNYYRIKSVMKKGTFYTGTIKMIGGQDTNLVVITNAVKKSKWQDSLSFTTSNEINVDYYLIEKSAFIKQPYFTEVIKIPAKGDSLYKINIPRAVAKKPYYRIKAVYKNGKVSTPIVFK